MNKSRFVLCIVMAMLLVANAVNAQGQRERTGPAGPPGDSSGPCTTVGTINALPFNDNTVDSCTGVAAITDYTSGNCNPPLSGYPGPEVAYEITVGAGNSGITMTLNPAAADLGIFLVDTCGVGTSCVAFNDAIGGGVASDIGQGLPGGADMIPNPLTPASYFVYIDSYYAAGGLHCGGFTLDITGTLPVELLSFEID